VKKKILESACVALLLALFIAAAANEIASTSATYDEPVHIAAGYSYARWGDYRINPEHPPLVKRLAAIPLRNVTPIETPLFHPTEPSLTEIANEWHAALADPSAEWTFAHNLLYGIRGSALARLGRSSGFQVEGTDPLTRADFLNDADAMVKRARWMVVPFGVILGLLVWFWTRELFGPFAAILSLALFAFEPSLAAHSAVVTTDVPLACCLFGAVFFYWRCTAPHPALRATLSPQAGRGETRSALPFSPPRGEKVAEGRMRGVALLNAAAFVLFAAAAFLVKFTAIVLVPLLAILALVRRSKPAFALVGAAAIATYVAIWASYGFRYSAATDPVAAATSEQSVAAQRPLPGLPDRVGGHFPLEYSLRRYAADARFFDEHRRTPTEEEAMNAFQYAPIRGLGSVLLAVNRMHLLPEAYVYGAAFARERSVFRSSFLRGEYSDTGFGSYFFWTVLLKTPVPALILIAAAVIVVMFTRAHRVALRFAWIPVLIYLLVAVRANLNIGHRHLLPIYPFLFVMCGVLAVRWARFAPRVKWAIAAAVLALIAFTGWQSDRLSYMNVRDGHRFLVDSNYDWGQDLVKLRRWLDANNVTEPINLCYFGTADPRYHGIRHRNLFLGYEYEPDNGFDAVPGLLAISATHLAGAQWDPAAREEWRKFMERTGAQPIARAGQSILIYRLRGGS
jgi:4-amino-4-deoxy-L-arabinose transferase-like glycosyltransferase